MHDCFTIELTGKWSEVRFVSTDGRRACRRGVIGSTMGAYPRGTGSNPVEGNGHFFPSYRQLYLSSFSDTHTRAHVRTLINVGRSPTTQTRAIKSFEVFLRLRRAACRNHSSAVLQDGSASPASPHFGRHTD